MTKFPKVLYVRQDQDDDETYLIAYDNLEDVVESDGETTVAIYNLTEQTKTYEKVARPVLRKESK